MSEENLWDIENISLFFKTSASTVYRAIVCRPNFPRPIKVKGMHKRWVPQEVKEWAESQRV